MPSCRLWLSRQKPGPLRRDDLPRRDRVGGQAVLWLLVLDLIDSNGSHEGNNSNSVRVVRLRHKSSSQNSYKPTGESSTKLLRLGSKLSPVGTLVHDFSFSSWSSFMSILRERVG